MRDRSRVLSVTLNSHQLSHRRLTGMLWDVPDTSGTVGMGQSKRPELPGTTGIWGPSLPKAGHPHPGWSEGGGGGGGFHPGTSSGWNPPFPSPVPRCPLRCHSRVPHPSVPRGTGGGRGWRGHRARSLPATAWLPALAEGPGGSGWAAGGVAGLGTLLSPRATSFPKWRPRARRESREPKDP